MQSSYFPAASLSTVCFSPKRRVASLASEHCRAPPQSHPFFCCAGAHVHSFRVAKYSDCDSRVWHSHCVACIQHFARHIRSSDEHDHRLHPPDFLLHAHQQEILCQRQIQLGGPRCADFGRQRWNGVCAITVSFLSCNSVCIRPVLGSSSMAL